MYDAIIVGGGPGGSSAGNYLAKKGRKVLILDRAKFPRLKVCAGWITPGALELLELKPSDYTGTIQRFSSGSVYIGGKYYHTDYKKTASFGIIRKEFDHFLVKRAVASGAEFLDGVRVKQVSAGENGVSVVCEDGRSFEARLIIGAGGTGCPVSRQLAERSEDEIIIQATESETRIGAETLRKLTPYFGTTELFPEEDFYGYAWYVTKGDFVNIGIGRFNHRTKNLNEYLDKFMAKLRAMGRVQGIEEQMVPFSRHAYKLYDETYRQKVGNRFLLIGDAAGFASKWAGEGIKPAIHTGILAAKTVDFALSAGDFSPGFLSQYESECIKAYGPQEKTAFDSLASKVPDSLKKRFAGFVCTSPYLRKKLIFEAAFGFQPVDF